MILEHLYADGILSDIEKDVINGQMTLHLKLIQLLGMLPTRGPEAFEVFLKALKEENCDFIVEKLRAAEAAYTELKGLWFTVLYSTFVTDATSLSWFFRSSTGRSFTTKSIT